jgi:ribosomal protein L37AE/L43A
MSLTLHTCPSCSSVLTFRSRDTNLIVCHQCGNRLQRWDDGVLKEKPLMVKAQDTFTPIQIGTTGVWSGKKFTVIGRVRCLFEEDYANNWSIYFEDGTLHTLVDCYGQLAVYEKIPPDPKMPYFKVSGLGIGEGSLESIDNKWYILERKSKCKSIEVEGETWVFDWNGEFTSLEIASEGGDRIELLNLENQVYLNFRIHYVAFEDFNFQQLRQLQIGKVTKTYTCTHCNKPGELKSFPLSQSWNCKHCGAALSYVEGRVKFRRRMKHDKNPAIPLYTKGVLKGIEYEMIGFAVKQDAHGWSWREYTLFNPVRGYAFLSEYNGHWTFLRETAVAPVMRKSQSDWLVYGTDEFQLYNGYHFNISDAYGEFPGDVFEHDNIGCREFICPPELWARELHPNGLCWYHGEHIDCNELYAAFGQEVSLPYRSGIGAIQPVRGVVNPAFLRVSVIGVVLIFLFVFLIGNVFLQNKVVYENTWYLEDTLTSHKVVTPKFKLDKSRANLLVTLQAPVVNNWFEANITLVNADNGTEYTIEEGVEYYSGYEGGESWSEGSTETDEFIQYLPKGTYFMEIMATKPVGNSPAYYTIEAKYDVAMWRNFFIFVLMAIIPGLGAFLYARNREKIRWENSAFSPYSTNDE